MAAEREGMQSLLREELSFPDSTLQSRSEGNGQQGTGKHAGGMQGGMQEACREHGGGM